MIIRLRRRAILCCRYCTKFVLEVKKNINRVFLNEADNFDEYILKKEDGKNVDRNASRWRRETIECKNT